MKTGKQRRANRKWRNFIPNLWKREFLREARSNLRFVRKTLEGPEQAADEARGEGSVASWKKTIRLEG